MREKLVEVMKDTRANAAWHRWSYEESADHLIANGVTIPVRCKDCKNWGRYEPTSVSGRCRLECKMRMEDDFCSYGERKDK